MELWQKKDNPAIRLEAIRLTEDNAGVVAAWCGGQLVEEIDPEHPEETQPGINVTVKSGGVKRASLHQYIVKFTGQFYVENNRVFETAYEPVNRAAPPLESSGDTRKRLGFADPFDSNRMP